MEAEKSSVLSDKNQRIKERLNKVFQETFKDPTIQIREDMFSLEIEDWDSFGHLMLMHAIEEEFKLDLDLVDTRHMVQVGDFLNYLYEHC